MSFPIEIILNRQLADCLAIPVFITDTVGNLLFYNESAEHILGKRYEDTGEMKVEEWSTIFKSKDEMLRGGITKIRGNLTGRFVPLS